MIYLSIIFVKILSVIGAMKLRIANTTSFIATITETSVIYLSKLQETFKPPTTQLGDNHIQNFHLGRYIVGYTVGNLVLWRGVSGALKRDFQTYIRRYTSPNEDFEYGYPHSNALLTFTLPKDCENVLCCA